MGCLLPAASERRGRSFVKIAVCTKFSANFCAKLLLAFFPKTVIIIIESEREVNKMNIIIIHEDNHGVLGVAKDYDSAINFLVQTQWLTTDVAVLNSIRELVPIKELGLDIETIKSWDIEAFNDFFDGIFYLDVDFLWGM